MNPAARITLSPDSPRIIFEDGLGQRTRRADGVDGQATEVLRLRASFATVPSFEFALRERAGRLAGFRHPSFVRVRGVERSGDAEPLLSVVSDAAPGLRLSAVLAGAQARRVPLDIYAALCVVRQLVSAMATLHGAVRDVAHGTLAPERLFITPQSRLLIAEPVLGAAIEQLRLPCERYWRELRVVVPPGTTRPRLDARTDVMQIGVVALSLVLGRPLRDDESPLRIGELVSSVWAVSPRGGFEPLPHGLRGWLARALQIEPHRAFASPIEARSELQAVLGDSELTSSPASLDAFLARYRASDAPAPAVVRTAPSVRETVAVEAVVSAVSPDSSASHTRTPVQGSRTRSWWTQRRRLAVVLVVLAVAGAWGTVVARRLWAGGGTVAALGTLELSTRPATVDAFIDGERRGATPLVVALDAGPHTVELRGAGKPRRIQLTITPGMKVTQYVDLTTALAPNPRRAPARQR
ncbi:MAG: hypothetical protein ABL982_10270 [Vicinamibacterales bacterium]